MVGDQMFEYKVIRAPEEQGRSILGRAKSSYAEALEFALNEQGLEDWEFQRIEFGPDKQALLVFRRTVKKLEDDLPGSTLAQHRPPRPEVQPRRARELLDEDRETLDRLKAGRRKILVEKPAEKAPPALVDAPRTNVADILAEKIARAKAAAPKQE